MFQLSVNGRKAVFSKFFAAADAAAVLGAVEGAGRVVFVDTPATAVLVGVVKTLTENGVKVVVRDHHDVVAPRNPREAEVAAAAARIRELVGANALISDRATHPACSSLIATGEFAGEGTVVVADPDPDGLTAAMKGLGVVYPELDRDAAVLDGPRAEQTAERLSPLAALLTRAMSALPAYDAGRPQVSEDAKGKLFADFVSAVEARAVLEKYRPTGQCPFCGYPGEVEGGCCPDSANGTPWPEFPDHLRSVEATALAAEGRMAEMALAYEAGVLEAKRLAATVQDILPGVAYVDAVAAARFDLGTLASAMEARPGVVVTVQRKSAGPIAAAERKAGRAAVQLSLAVVRAKQAEVNLQAFLPAGFTSSPEKGVISNTSFLLHVSEGVWEETVLPALRAKFGA
ncbi:MAG: hypothetical protein WC730_02215 [Patescibacteria group bacterium]|jgi:hypothetical protein